MAAFTVLLTGATSGIGLETARALATPDRRLILACRNRSKAETLRQQLLSAQPACQVAAPTDSRPSPSLRPQPFGRQRTQT